MILKRLHKFFKSIFRKFTHQKIRAVQDEDLPSLLSAFGVLDQIDSEECLCLSCDAVINLHNIGAIVTTRGKVAIICSNLSCIAEV